MCTWKPNLTIQYSFSELVSLISSQMPMAETKTSVSACARADDDSLHKERVGATWSHRARRCWRIGNQPRWIRLIENQTHSEECFYLTKPFELYVQRTTKEKKKDGKRTLCLAVWFCLKQACALECVDFKCSKFNDPPFQNVTQISATLLPRRFK